MCFHSTLINLLWYQWARNVEILKQLKKISSWYTFFRWKTWERECENSIKLKAELLRSGQIEVVYDWIDFRFTWSLKLLVTKHTFKWDIVQFFGLRWTKQTFECFRLGPQCCLNVNETIALNENVGGVLSTQKMVYNSVFFT